MLKRLLTAALLVLATAGASLGGAVSLLGAGINTPSVPPVAIAISTCSHTNGSFTAGVATFTSQSLCSVVANSINVVVVSADGNAAISSVLVDGVSATLGVAARNTTPTPDREAEVWYVAGDVNVTGTIVVTSGDTVASVSAAISVFQLSGGLSGTPAKDTTATDTSGQCNSVSTIVLSPVVANNSGTLAGVTCASGGATASWTGATEYADVVQGAILTSSASVATVSGTTLTITPTSSGTAGNGVGAAVSFK